MTILHQLAPELRMNEAPSPTISLHGVDRDYFTFTFTFILSSQSIILKVPLRLIFTCSCQEEIEVRKNVS